MKYLRRLIWYICTRLLILCCALGLATMAFYFSMNATNIYIIVKDGMAKRAQVVMLGAEENLTNYFSTACQERDAQLTEARNGQSPYQLYYNITGFDHRITLDSFWCWPWDDTARAQVTERIPAIDGKMKSSMKEEAAAAGYEDTTPQWQSAQYTVLLGRENGQWHIKNMSLNKAITDE
ncbi:MAG: hypothetical protein E7329_03375 [Clostridiales bacterium]|nr:hypothetical protein [Clostridiales bacterium]